MKKILLVALALTLGLSASAQMRKNVYAPEKSTKDGPAWSQIHTPFSTQDINGNPVNVADTLAAGKAIVIDYSATWCNPCYRFHNSKVLEAFMAPATTLKAIGPTIAMVLVFPIVLSTMLPAKA